MSDNTFNDGQLAKAIYLKQMSAMKAILNLGEMNFGGRNDNRYKLYKKIVMDEFYNAMGDLFSAMELEGILVKCPCGASIRQGYKPCERCNGSGHCNSESFDDYIENAEDEENGILPV